MSMIELMEMQSMIDTLSSKMTALSSTLSTVSSKVNSIYSGMSGVGKNGIRRIVLPKESDSQIVAKKSKKIIYEYNGSGIFHQLSTSITSSYSNDVFGVCIYIDGVLFSRWRLAKQRTEYLIPIKDASNVNTAILLEPVGSKSIEPMYFNIPFKSRFELCVENTNSTTSYTYDNPVGGNLIISI